MWFYKLYQCRMTYMAYFVPNNTIYISRFKHVMRTEKTMSFKRKSSSAILNTFIIITFAFCCYLTKQVRSMTFRSFISLTPIIIYYSLGCRSVPTVSEISETPNLSWKPWWSVIEHRETKGRSRYFEWPVFEGQNGSQRQPHYGS